MDIRPNEQFGAVVEPGTGGKGRGHFKLFYFSYNMTDMTRDLAGL